eukprot:scaffold49383_cov27-Tisochrysis_lutea.AAC.12
MLDVLPVEGAPTTSNARCLPKLMLARNSLRTESIVGMSRVVNESRTLKPDGGSQKGTREPQWIQSPEASSTRNS